MMDDLLDRSSWGMILFSALTQGDLATILLILALVAFVAAVWRAVSRDVAGPCCARGWGWCCWSSPCSPGGGAWRSLSTPA
jgi:hypothetical protein